MSESPLEPQVAVESRVTVVTLGPAFGTLDEHVLDTGLGDKLLKIAGAANPPLVVLDLSHTTFFGSSFIEVLFRLWHQIQTRPGGTFALCGLTEHCLEVLTVTHLDTLWRHFANRGEAVAGLSATAH